MLAIILSVLIPFFADSAVYSEPRPAVIICPGGSYSWLDKYDEGTVVAKWLQQNGIHAYVLLYSVQGKISYVWGVRWFNGMHKYPDPLNDFWNAYDTVKQNPKVSHVGAMGFSAGGHLVMMAAELGRSPLKNSKRTTKNPTSNNNKLDFVAPIYPVVTFQEGPFVHKRSRRALLGLRKRHNKIMQDSLSLELHVPEKGMPPVFLVNCKDDQTVHYHNSELLDSALSAKNVPHRYIQYRTGNHGFGASEKKGTQECRQWKKEFLNWLNELSLGK